MITIYFDDESIKRGYRYSIWDHENQRLGVREGGEPIGGQKKIEVQPTGPFILLSIFTPEGVISFEPLRDNVDFYAFTGVKDDELTRLRKIELAAIADQVTPSGLHTPTLRKLLGMLEESGRAYDVADLTDDQLEQIAKSQGGDPKHDHEVDE